MIKNKKLLRNITKITALIMIASTLMSAITATAFADTSTDNQWDYEIIGSSGGINYIKLTKYNGSDADVVIPDIIDTTNYVVDVGTDVFAGSSGITSLHIGRYMTAGNDSVFDDLKDCSTYTVDVNNSKYSADDGVLYRQNKLLAYPKAKTGSYTIKDNSVIGHRAFLLTNIDTLTIPGTVTITNASTGSKYEYSFLGANVGMFNYNGDTSGAIIDGGRLVAYGENSSADISAITDANPYAFYSENKLSSVTLPDTVQNVPFTFYSGEIDGLPTRYFNLNGKTAYCYNFGKKNPEKVNASVNYDDAVENAANRLKVKSVLFAGYPNDAYNLQATYGISDECAKNITGSLVWEALDPSLHLGMDEIYLGNETGAAEYRNDIEEKIGLIGENEMSNFVVKMNTAEDGNSQNLIMIEQLAAPVPTATIKVTKKDKANDTALAGAKFKLEKDGALVLEWDSTTDAKTIDDLLDGNYTIKEVQAPSGYKAADDVTFTVTSGVASEAEFVIYNEKKKTPTPRPDPDPRPSRPDPDPTPGPGTPKPEPKPEQLPEPDPMPPQPQPEPQPQPQPQPQPEPKPEPVAPVKEPERKPVKTGDPSMFYLAMLIGSGLGLAYLKHDDE